jgi:hypothetical protein
MTSPTRHDTIWTRIARIVDDVALTVDAPSILSDVLAGQASDGATASVTTTTKGD